MKLIRLPKLFSLNKRQKFVISVLLLGAGVFASEFATGVALFPVAFVLGFLTIVFLYFAIHDDLKDIFSYPIFILPFFFTVSFVLFYPLIPARLFTRIIMTALFMLGTYSLFLTQNIFVVSAIRTINLMRSARIVSFVLTIIVLFFLANIIFSIRLPLYVSPLILFVVVLLLNFQSLWSYALGRELIPQAFTLSLLGAFCITELSLVLNMWPVTAAIYSIFITGIFYAYSGLTHAWVEKRLFKGVLWEYIWVGFLAILILVFFSKWGL